MNRFIKAAVFGAAGLAVVLSVARPVSATGLGERSVAGLSKTMDGYYTSTVDYAGIQTLSIEEDYGDNLGIADVDNHLNIRSGAGTNYSVVGKLPKDAGCYIYSIDENGWAKISSGGVKGYVSTEFLIMGDEAKKYAKEVGFFAVTVTTQTLNVRTEPNTDSQILAQIADSRSFEIADESTIGQEWIKIYVDDTEGYVCSDYVDVSFMLKKAVSDFLITVNGETGVSLLRANMVAFAKQYLGNRYVYGGNSLTNGIDCSGFTKAIYANFGYSIPRTAATQANCATRISASQLRPGDLVCYFGNGYVSHVAMYIGNGQIIHASNPRDGIMISKMNYQTPYCYVRVIND